MAKNKMTFKMAVYKYACHLQDSYGQSISNGEYPCEECSIKDAKGAWYLRGYTGTSRLAKVEPNGFVRVGY